MGGKVTQTHASLSSVCSFSSSVSLQAVCATYKPELPTLQVARLLLVCSNLIKSLLTNSLHHFKYGLNYIPKILTFLLFRILLVLECKNRVCILFVIGYKFGICINWEDNIGATSPILLPSASQSFKEYFEYFGFSAKRKKAWVHFFLKIISHTLVFAQFDELQLLNKWKSILWAGLRKCSVFSFQVKNEWNFR